MAKEALRFAGHQGWSQWPIQAGRQLLLVPEAIVIAILMAVAVLGEPMPLVGLAVALLTASLVVRVAAMYLAQRALAGARYREATRLARVAYLLHPWSADVLALRGAIALAGGAIEDAVWFLRRSLELFPDSALTQATLASALLASGRVAAGRLAAQRAIGLDVRCAPAYLYLAEAELLSGTTEREVEDLLRRGMAVASRPEDEAALRCALAALLLSGERAAEAALALGGVERLIGISTPSARARLRLRYGELLIAQGHLERAREYLQGTVVVDLRGGQSALWNANQP